MPSKYRLAVTTTSSMEEARKLAHALVEERLAACVNIVERIESVYRWQGAVEEAGEVLLLIKTSVEKLEALQTAVMRLHSYEVPEFLVFSVDQGSPSYLEWIEDSLNSFR